MGDQSTKQKNRQLKKRLQAIQNKLHNYVELGVDVALILRYPEKEFGYSYVSSEEFLQTIDRVRSHPNSINKTPKEIEKMRSQTRSKTTHSAKKRKAQIDGTARVSKRLQVEEVFEEEEMEVDFVVDEVKKGVVEVDKAAIDVTEHFFPQPPTFVYRR